MSSGDKRLYIQVQYPDDPSVGDMNEGRMDQMLTDILEVSYITRVCTAHVSLLL